VFRRHRIEIGQSQRVDHLPEAVQPPFSSHLDAVGDVFRRVVELNRQLNALLCEVVNLAVLGEQPDRAIAEEKASHSPQ
jgi:hypothetical protein